MPTGRGTGVARGDPGRGHAGAGAALDLGTPASRSSRALRRFLRRVQRRRRDPPRLATPGRQLHRQSASLAAWTRRARADFVVEEDGHSTPTARTGPFSGLAGERRRWAGASHACHRRFDGDGVPEIVTVSGWTSPGIMSTPTTVTEARRRDSRPDGRRGRHVPAIGDVDGDGDPESARGVPGNHVVVKVLAADGTVERTMPRGRVAYGTAPASAISTGTACRRSSCRRTSR